MRVNARFDAEAERDFGAYRFKGREPFQNLLLEGRHG